MQLELSEKQVKELFTILMDPGTRAAAFKLDLPFERLAHTATLWEVIDRLGTECEWPIDG